MNKNVKPTLIVLAAGMGSRYGGLKQVDPVGPNDEAIIDYSIYDAVRAGFGKVVFVIRKHFADAFREKFERRLRGKIETEYVFQEIEAFVPVGVTVNPEREKPWGTGHAVLVARDVVDEPFAVINADDFYGPEAFRVVAGFLTDPERKDDEYCMAGYFLSNTLSEHGSVSRGICSADSEGWLKSVVERTKISHSGKKIVAEIEDGKTIELNDDDIVSMNFWGFMPSFFGHLENHFSRFIHENAQVVKGEFYIPSVVNSLIESGEARVKVLSSGASWFGVTYREDKPVAVARIRELTEKGIYPSNLWK
ncbi:MAG: nucleotidyltransferase [Bacteroidales bacterium]